MAKKKNEISIRSSAAEYLTYVASVGGQEDSIEMRYEDENIWLTQKLMATLYDVAVSYTHLDVYKRQVRILARILMIPGAYQIKQGRVMKSLTK